MKWTASVTDSITPKQVYVVRANNIKGKGNKGGKQIVETVVIRGTELDTILLNGRAALDKINPVR